MYGWQEFNFCDLLIGTIQGSILGPMLFDLELFVAFAEDNFIPRLGHSI
jgi:hypothetical protein